jgi:FkbM family methyltransferase
MDIGAGVGEETLTLSRAVGEHGKIICVEAHPRTFRCLEKLVQYNRLENVIPIHAAIAEPGRSTVSIENGNEYLANRIGSVGAPSVGVSRTKVGSVGVGRIGIGSGAVHVGLTVPALTIDQLCQRLNLARIHFLKMNIEGAERLAIQGMSTALQRTNILCISCHDFLAKRNSAGDEVGAQTAESFYRTKDLVRQFLQKSGLKVVERNAPALPPYIQDQLWAYNHSKLK